MKINSKRGKDLGLRLCVFFEHFCKVQKLKLPFGIPAIVEFIVELMEEKK